MGDSVPGRADRLVGPAFRDGSSGPGGGPRPARAIGSSQRGRELGVEDIPRRVVVAADIVLGRQLDRGTVLRALEDESHDAHRPPDADDGIEAPRRLGRTATLIWQVARDLRRVNKDLDNRPGAGRFVALMRNLPAVGAASAFAYERRGIARAADQARDAFDRP